MLDGRRRDMPRAIRARRTHRTVHRVQQRPRDRMHRRAHRDRGKPRHRLVRHHVAARQDQRERTRPERGGQPIAATVPLGHQHLRVDGVDDMRDQRIVGGPPLQLVHRTQRTRRQRAGPEAVHGLRWKRGHAAFANARRGLADARVVARNAPRHLRLQARAGSPRPVPRGSSAGRCPSRSTVARSRCCTRRARASPASARSRAPADAGTSAPGTRA